jgi:uncharacterized coiled-coil protein SlyX
MDSTDPSRFEAIEIKLAHLERSLQELSQALLQQQRQIDSLAARDRAIADRLDAFEATGGPEAEPFERPPHY